MRELTGDTRIRIRRPRPELTGDTRIRLSQIKDLAAWIEDRRYQNGEISQTTGLMKTPDGWVVPPHSMVPGPQEPIENTHRIGGGAGQEKNDPRFRKNRSAKNNTVLDIKNPVTFKKDTPITNDAGWYIPAGSRLENAKSIARAEGIDEVRLLVDNYLLPGGKKTNVKDWEKIAGNTDLTKNGKKRRAHVHGYRAKGVGKVKMKRVNWLPPKKR